MKALSTHQPAACQRCQILPEPLVQSGTLYLSPPLDHTSESLRSHLLAEGLPPEEPMPGIIAVRMSAGRMRAGIEGLAKVLTPAELQETKTLVVAEGGQPSLADLMKMQPLSALVAAVQGEWLIELLRQSRLETHFQPIVHTGRPGEIYAYECLLRGRDSEGQLIGPDRLFGAARSSDLLFHLDRQARLTAIRSAFRYGVKQQVFINFNPSSIYNPAACLKSTVQAVREIGATPGQFVFEVVESEQVPDANRLQSILDFYRAEGFQVALDDVGAGYSSLNLLTRLKPDYIKLDMHLIRNVDLDAWKAQVVGKLLEMAQALGVQTVMEGIETEGEWRWALEHGANYTQGYLFARPASPPPAVNFSARGPSQHLRELSNTLQVQ